MYVIKSIFFLMFIILTVNEWVHKVHNMYSWKELSPLLLPCLLLSDRLLAVL